MDYIVYFDNKTGDIQIYSNTKANANIKNNIHNNVLNTGISLYQYMTTAQVIQLLEDQEVMKSYKDHI